VNKGSRVRILGIAALISTIFALPHLLVTPALAGDSGSSTDSVAPPELNLAKLVPQISLAKPTPINLEGDAMMRYMISVENYKAFANSLFQPATYLKPLAEHLNSSRAWVYVKDQDGKPLQTFGTINNREQLKSLWFAIERETAAPSHVYVDIWDRQTDTHFKSSLLKIENN
jgi:hypothetical protein